MHQVVVIRRYSAHFGISPSVSVDVGARLDQTRGKECQPKLLLWSCLLLKTYYTDEDLRTLACVDAAIRTSFKLYIFSF